MHNLSALQEAILAGDAETAVEKAQKALDEGHQPLVLINRGITPAMSETGKRFEEGEFFVPELLMAAKATKAIFEILRPLLAQSGSKPRGTVILGTVRGDQHDIGKNLVGAMLEGGGFEVADLGVDVSPERFVAAVEEKQAQIIGLSALLTSTLPAMKKVVEALQEAGVRTRVKIMVGGAPVTPQYAETIGADAYGANASESVEIAHRLSAEIK